MDTQVHTSVLQYTQVLSQHKWSGHKWSGGDHLCRHTWSGRTTYAWI